MTVAGENSNRSDDLPACRRRGRRRRCAARRNPNASAGAFRRDGAFDHIVMIRCEHLLGNEEVRTLQIKSPAAKTGVAEPPSPAGATAARSVSRAIATGSGASRERSSSSSRSLLPGQPGQAGAARGSGRADADRVATSEQAAESAIELRQNGRAFARPFRHDG